MIDDGMPVGDPKDRQITALRAEVERFKVSLSDAVRQTQEQADDIIALRADNERLREWNREIALNAREFAADNERLRAYALKAFTVVEFCCGEGFLLEPPFYDCDDLLLEGVNLLNVETAEEARTALEGKHD